MATKSLTRKQLYDQVWSEPMSKLAARFGLSDVGLAKICRKHDIPRPPRGYWARQQAGHKVKQTPLPKSASDDKILLSEPIDSASADTEKAERQPKVETVIGPPVVVAETLRGCHPLVSEANQQFQVAKTDELGMIEVPDAAILHIRVSKASLRRALLIADAVLKACEQRGYKVSAGPSVKILDQVLRFSIVEQVETIREQLSDPNLEGRYEFHFNRFRTSQKPSGMLSLILDDAKEYWARGLQSTWRESDKRRLEDRLDKFVAAMSAVVARKTAYDEEQKRQQAAAREAEKRRQEEAERRAERRKLYNAEKAKVDSLLATANSWRKSQKLREYIEARRQQHLAEHGAVEPDSKFAIWLAWANQQADRMDPLRPSPPSILDEEELGREDPPRGNQWSWNNR
jgi:hypothetical protein